MTHGVQAGRDQVSEMQLVGRLALSAAAVLLLTLAYRYCKSRAARAGDDGGVEAEEETVFTGRTETVFGGTNGVETRVRQRRVDNMKVTVANSGSADLPVDPGRPEFADRSRLRGTPVKRRDKAERTKVSHLGVGDPPGTIGLVSEEEEKGTSGGLLSYGNQAEVTAEEPHFQEYVFCNPEKIRWDADECGEQQTFGERQPERENWSSTKIEKGDLLGGEGPSPSLVQIQEIPKEKLDSFQATSDLGLVLKQSHTRTHSSFTFSSVAKVQIEENVIQGKESKEGSDGPTEPNLRGKVYDLQSVETKTSSHSVVDTQLFHVLNQPEKNLYPKPDQARSDHGNDRRTFQKATEISSGEDVPKPKGREERNTKKHPLSRFTFTRNDSFRKIVDNPELQVPMKGFGSPALGSSGKDTPILVKARSSSTSSLMGSVQSLQSDTKEEPTVEQVAGAKFFHVPLGPESSLDVHLDLGNCHEVLSLAKKQKLEALQDAAYKVMADNYLQVLRTHGIYSRLNAAERELILKRRQRGRKYVTVADVNSNLASRLCFYDDREDAWQPLTPMPLEAVSKGCAVCSMFNYLFLVAGCEGRGRAQRPSKRVFCYNPLTNIWREICPLNQARPHCKLVALDGYLYAIGGECLYTVERYDPRTDRWTFVAPLPNDTFAVAHTATTCDGEIYVTGGTLRYTLLKYVARSDTWKANLTSGSQHRTTDMVTANGFIYRFDLDRSAGISVYRCGAKAKLWYECATYPMPFPTYFQCTVVENLVYCIGRQFHIRFLTDYVSPRFGTKELQTFPSPQGSLLPVTLVLPDKDSGQTRV
ncbi:kelch domain-containing protein 7A [Anolis carolinensis]|uniref:kelch domain-containing protein 7A n=1 Tax=Anolis carolinensis TaxID=28377 RepID=UPI002F2B4D8E